MTTYYELWKPDLAENRFVFCLLCQPPLTWASLNNDVLIDSFHIVSVPFNCSMIARHMHTLPYSCFAVRCTLFSATWPAYLRYTGNTGRQSWVDCLRILRKALQLKPVALDLVSSDWRLFNFFFLTVSLYCSCLPWTLVFWKPFNQVIF